MSDWEWQPARFNLAKEVWRLHGGHGIDLTTTKLNEGILVRIRPIDKKPPCNAERGFEIHPDDIAKTADNKPWVCEHQILTD